MPTKLSHQQFLEQLNKRNCHYSVVVCLDQYQSRRVRLNFQCQENHTWLSLPDNVLRGSGCPICSRKQVKSHEEFNRQLTELNNNRTNKVFLSEGMRYKNAFTKLSFVCDKNHSWQTTPSNIINSSHTCRICSGKAKKTTQQFIEELNTKITNIGLVKDQEYTSAHNKLLFSCDRKHHTWYARPIDILVGYGCPHCVKKGYSVKAIKWLNQISTNESVVIQHAQNDGEYLIPGTNWYADGFCKQTNTIYEFYGDVYHGNPKIFTTNQMCHPYDKIRSAGMLYDQTKRREQKLIKLGYNVITIWETDYDDQFHNT